VPLPLSFIVTAALSLATHRQQPNTRPFDRVIGVDLRGATIADALATIADSAHITIDYNRTDVGAVAQHVTYLASRVTVGTALEHVLGNRFVAHEAGINQVIVTRADTVVTVSGVVSDSASHQPIASVNVLLNGSKIGTVTGADGAFRLRIPNADTTLLFFRIGYQRHEVRVRDGTTVLNVRLGQTPQSLSAVQVTASTNQQPVEHTPDIAVVQEIKMAPSVVSGISSEQIAKMADINVAQIVRHISGVTVRDESFLVVRGMNERYNATYLDDNLAPSTELYSRAFDLSLLPDRIVDKILVYKSPRADLIGDMTGAAVKIYTKDALAIRRFDLSVRVGDRVNSTGKDMLSYSGGRTDWLGVDDGTRAAIGCPAVRQPASRHVESESVPLVILAGPQRSHRERAPRHAVDRQLLRQLAVGRGRPSLQRDERKLHVRDALLRDVHPAGSHADPCRSDIPSREQLRRA
jgi:hypothetical protein